MALVQRPLAAVLAQPRIRPPTRPRGQARRASAGCRPTSPCCARSCRATAATPTKVNDDDDRLRRGQGAARRARRRRDRVLERRGRRAAAEAAGHARVPRRRLRRARLPGARAVRDAPDARRAAAPSSAATIRALQRGYRDARTTRRARVSAMTASRARTSTAHALLGPARRGRARVHRRGRRSTASCGPTCCAAGRRGTVEFGILDKPLDVRRGVRHDARREADRATSSRRPRPGR